MVSICISGLSSHNIIQVGRNKLQISETHSVIAITGFNRQEEYEKNSKSSQEMKGPTAGHIK